MSTSTATPPVPPRPVRAQAAAVAQGADKLPHVPPRPTTKRLDRSVSPGNFPRSPLYDLPSASPFYRPKTHEEPMAPIVRKPSVQNMPSVGQEGSEYADIQYQPNVPSALAADAAAQTRSIGEDLKLHAPKPSLPTSSAKAQVQAVTRTDPHQAASHGFGKPPTPSYEDHEHLHQIRSRASVSRTGSTASAERRASTFIDDHGPGETGGIRVPINPLLGDVQAPSPAPVASGLTPNHTGVQKQRHHNRTKSGREVFLPPGSYGLHGHGVVPNDRFENDWYQKHPEQLAAEEQFGHGVYESIGSGRGNFALSSDDLNKIVRGTANRGSASGTDNRTMSYPDEQIGYMASEQYAAPNYLSKLHSNHSQPHVESPLRKASFPTDEQSREEFRATKKAPSTHSKSGDDAIEEPDVHVAPKRLYSKMTGGEETLHETEEARPYIRERSSNGGLADEHGYTVPILAEDEVARGGSEFMHPAISPRQDRRGSAYDLEHRSGDLTPSSRPASRPGSRPGSIYGLQGVNHSLSRFATHHDDRENVHTPLEDVAEYEPLFPEDDSLKRPLSHAERFKQRPELWKHRFPSQDIWEDTPDSSMYVTTVLTPENEGGPDESKQLGESKPQTSLEQPKIEAVQNREPVEPERIAKSKFAAHLRDETRPGMKPRFPSQDIWEDSPESQYLVTTVSGPQMEEETSPVEAKPTIPPRPVGKSMGIEETSPPQAAPVIPARPAKYSVPPADAKLTDLSIPPNKPSSKETSPVDRKAPIIPERPKPQVPARPAKKSSGDSLSKTISATSAGSVETEKAIKSPPVTKAKPVIPARPASKIQSLKGNFMNDLNQKLGLGPPKEKEPEPEAEPEIKPLEDARKGRARGPQRRAPAKSPPASETAKPPTLSMFAPQAHWHIDPDHGILNVHSHNSSTSSVPATEPSATAESEVSFRKVEQIDHATLAATPRATALSMNTAGEPTDPEAESIAAPPAPSQEIANPLDHDVADEANLSQHTTKSTEYSGHTLTREEPDPSTDAIPISQQSTAETEESGVTLAQADTHDPTENKKAGEVVE